MRHHNTNKKFGRQTGERTALMNSLLLSLISHGKITTTEAKAKALRPRIEKLITRARRATPSDLRIIKSRLNNNATAMRKIVKEIAPGYKERRGGYTRITKLGQRSGKGDASPVAVIEFVK